MKKQIVVNIIIALISLMLTLAAGEMVLRLCGYKLGIYTKWEMFHPVDSLILYNNYENDENGIYHFSPWISDSLGNCFNCSSLDCSSPEFADKFHPIDDPTVIYRDFCRLDTAKKSELGETIRQIRKGQTSNSAIWADALTIYVQRPFNTNGFRSIPFLPYENAQHPRVMLVGDSFVYGLSAHPITNSFYDRLLARGYIIYNFGIPGTDPAQYAAIIEKYIPLLKPDAVVVCFFPGNDLMKFNRTVKQEYPIEYITNAGLMYGDICGKHYDAHEAYSYYLNLVSVPQEKMFDRLCSKSVIGSLFWGFLYNNAWVSHPQKEAWEQCNVVSEETAIATTKAYINQWEATCKKEKVVLLNTVLPDLNSSANDSKGNLRTNYQMMNMLFGNNYHAPDRLGFNKQVQYDGKDGHFDSEGHKLYADFLDSLLRNMGLSPNKQALYEKTSQK